MGMFGTLLMYIPDCVAKGKQARPSSPVESRLSCSAQDLCTLVESGPQHSW